MKKLILLASVLMFFCLPKVAVGAANDIKMSQQNSGGTAWIDRIFQPASGTAVTNIGTFRTALGVGIGDTPTFAGIIDSGLTDGRVAIVTTAGRLVDDADLTFSVDTLTATKGTFGGVTHISNAVASVNSLTSVAASNLVLATGSSGTALTFASATNIATFAAGVIAPSFAGAGTGLTGTAASLTAGAATTAGTVTTAAQPSITSVGTLTSLTTSGNVTSTATSGTIFNGISATTGYLALRLTNSGGDSYFGIENSTGGVFGATAYATTIFGPVELDVVLSAGKRLVVTTAGISTAAITQSAGQVLNISSGTNQRAGNATLTTGGTVTVTNTTVSSNTIVILTRKTSGGTPGTAISYTVSAGASFTVTSDNVLDRSVYSYLLVEVP